MRDRAWKKSSEREKFFSGISASRPCIADADGRAWIRCTHETRLICTCALQYINPGVFRAHASASRKTSRAAMFQRILKKKKKRQVPEKRYFERAHTSGLWFVTRLSFSWLNPCERTRGTRSSGLPRTGRREQVGSDEDPTINREDETDRGNFAIRGRIHRLGSRLYFSLATYPHPQWTICASP